MYKTRNVNVFKYFPNSARHLVRVTPDFATVAASGVTIFGSLIRLQG